MITSSPELKIGDRLIVEFLFDVRIEN